MPATPDPSRVAAQHPPKTSTADGLALQPPRSSVNPSLMGWNVWRWPTLRWLSARGRPEIASACWIAPCDALHSPSYCQLTHYVQGLAEQRFADADALAHKVQSDWAALFEAGQTAHSAPRFRLLTPEEEMSQATFQWSGESLDRLDLSQDDAGTRQAMPSLQAATHEQPVTESLHSHLFRCQNAEETPDRQHLAFDASLQIHYTGAQIDQARLLDYLLHFRSLRLSPEQCIEKIHADLRACLQSSRLSVELLTDRQAGCSRYLLRADYPMRAQPMQRWWRQ